MFFFKKQNVRTAFKSRCSSFLSSVFTQHFFTSGFNCYHNCECKENPSLCRSLKPTCTRNLSISPSLGVICGKKRGERERRKKERKKKSLKLSELGNFYHLPCTFLPPHSPPNVKWQGRRQAQPQEPGNDRGNKGLVVFRGGSGGGREAGTVLVLVRRGACDQPSTPGWACCSIWARTTNRSLN